MIWILKDLDAQLQSDLKRYISLNKLGKDDFQYRSKFEFNQDIITLIANELLANYQSYKIFEAIRNDRKIPLKLEADIDQIYTILKERKLLLPNANKNK